MSLQLFQKPVVEKFVKFTSTTAGRDKSYRGVQFFARFLVWYLSRKGYDKEIIQRFNLLKNTLGSSRKLFRVGKFVEHLQNASKALNNTEGFAKFSTFGRQICYSIYLFLDSLSWINSTGAYKFNQIKRINETSARFWFIGIIFSISNGIYKLNQNKHRHDHFEKVSRSKLAEKDEHTNIRAETAKLKSERRALIRQMTIDFLDITIPATVLGYIKWEDGIIGLAGVISSILGAQPQWKKL
ncbi:hypothetical protein Glove_216g203 [Diversispora epigaea]|uniref:Peroxisomal biogenesis factor 11 n=1 Tax=Diversispora epigaea TaxID=1348612 RepID=A0A397IQ81_9GLOM|nr:hypothetical protein Glove_216g203 [Diversispora epigaea]